MAPQLFDLQLRDGAWAITVATMHQLKICRAFGIGRVLMANQLTGRLEIDAVLDELASDPAFDFYCLIDSLEGVSLLREAAARRKIGRPLQLLLEGGIAGGRTGARTLEQAVAVAARCASRSAAIAARRRGFRRADRRRLAAGAGREGRRLHRFPGRHRPACAAEDLFAPGPVILTAGGSAFFDLAATRLRNGSAAATSW